MTSPQDSPPTTHPPRTMLTAALMLIVGLAVLIVMRLHGFGLPLETDECNYAYIGARLLEGKRLYVDVWDHQPFGVYALFAGVISVFGDAPVVFRCMVLVFSAVSMLLVFELLRKTHGLFAAAVGVALFAIVSSDPGTGGEGCNRELYMNTFVLLAWYLAVVAPLGRAKSLTLAGLSLGVGSVIKTVVAAHWLALAVWIVLYRPPRDRRAGRWIDLALFSSGPAAVWIATTAYFTATGRFRDFVDAVFLFNLGYSDAHTASWHRLIEFFFPKEHPFIFESARPLWWIGAAATTWAAIHGIWRRRNEVLPEQRGTARRASASFALIVAGSFVAACLPGRFWPHYYYLLIPPLVLAVATGTAAAARWITITIAGTAAPTTARRIVCALLFAVVVLPVLATEYHYYLSRHSIAITRSRYNSRDFWGRAQGLNVKRVTDPGDLIFVYSNDASIYYYSDRRCASRYTMITGISGDLPGAAERRRILMNELRADPPRLILVLFGERPFPEWQAFLNKYYGEPIGWDFHDKTRKPIMFVLCRKDEPVPKINWDWDRSEIEGTKAK